MRFSNPLKALAPCLALLAQVQAMTQDMINSQVRLAYVGDSAMRVSWNTFQHEPKPTVYYGIFPEALVFRASSDVSVTYNTSLTYNNHVTIRGLLPDTTYYYLPAHLLQDDSTCPPYSFRTSRPAGDGTPYSAAVLVDLGTMGPQGLTTSAGQTVPAQTILKPGEKNTMQSLEKALNQYDFMLHRASKFALLPPPADYKLRLTTAYSWRFRLRRLMAAGRG